MHSILCHSDKLGLLWAGIIGTLSLTPGTSLPEVPISDKLEHFLAYALLGLLLSLRRHSIYALAATLLASIAYGSLIELIQPYLNRHGELGDILANSSGALAGVLTALLLQRRFSLGQDPGMKDGS
jgi:VanZ family protein